MLKNRKTDVDESMKDISEVLDKMLKLQETEKKTSPIKIIGTIVLGIAILMVVALICVCIYKNNFTTESILATLLAFFSIFISIFFYFKADETSTKFYDSSYKFMKDISVTLGKIEERFGEKLNSLNDKMSHIEKARKEASREIEDKQEDKDSLINELMEKANLNEEEKVKYKEELELKERQIEQLKRNRARMEREAFRLRRMIDASREENENSLEKTPGKNLLLDYLIKERIGEDEPENKYVYLCKDREMFTRNEECKDDTLWKHINLK